MRFSPQLPERSFQLMRGVSRLRFRPFIRFLPVISRPKNRNSLHSCRLQRFRGRTGLTACGPQPAALTRSVSEDRRTDLKSVLPAMVLGASLTLRVSVSTIAHGHSWR